MGRLSHAVTYNRDDRGIAYGARALGRRSARSSRRSHDLPAEAGKAGPQGEGAQVVTMSGDERHA